jgi:hypothetical protein
MELESNKKELLTKFNEIQDEILKIGWQGVLEKYHPDMNCDDPDACDVFKIYKHIYENIRKRLLVNQ